METPDSQSSRAQKRDPWVKHAQADLSPCLELGLSWSNGCLDPKRKWTLVRLRFVLDFISCLQQYIFSIPVSGSSACCFYSGFSHPRWGAQGPQAVERKPTQNRGQHLTFQRYFVRGWSRYKQMASTQSVMKSCTPGKELSPLVVLLSLDFDLAWWWDALPNLEVEGLDCPGPSLLPDWFTFKLALIYWIDSQEIHGSTWSRK